MQPLYSVPQGTLLHSLTIPGCSTWLLHRSITSSRITTPVFAPPRIRTPHAVVLSPTLHLLCQLRYAPGGICALLVGMIPAPELRSPFRDTGRGKTFQARVLKRLVNANFIDIETALFVLNESVNLRTCGPDYAEKLLFSLSSSTKKPGTMNLERGAYSTMKETWDWTREQMGSEGGHGKMGYESLQD